MTSLIITWALFCNGLLFLSLFCYRRHGAKFKIKANWFAMILMNFAAINVVRALTSIGFILPFTIPELIWESILCILVIIYDGNAARLLPWSKYDEVENQG